ncbi:MAG TPA: acyl-CoA mutase large subunit family protein [Candidatus Krumholzibacteria bacterium]|nr:acyl-CoA mutase large subunit family protein [Candidatus Krumholzibacteria bacterium]HPD72484.1 acyl-CoA mutase large subunit family protein [Candidatus Krumholzibacteria bacterium]HRY40584.1 acyl-CoA mutase large subunit family protein [Candidatus Krumholzibacteria bacterium]
MDDQRHDPTASLGLADLFPVPTLEQWHAECLRLLDGIPFEKQMLTPTYEGITLRPLYTRADLAGLPHLDSRPGCAPYVRGGLPLGYRERPWEVAQELPYPTCEEFGKALRHDLAVGQTAVVLVIDRAGQAGLDPDLARPEQVGSGGTSIAALDELDLALAGVDLAQVPLYLESGSAALAYAAMLVALASRRGVEPSRLRGSIGFDPLAGLAELGRVPVRLAQAYDELAVLTDWAAAQAPDLATLAVRGHVYHDGGASAVQELGVALAVAVHHLRELEQRGLPIELVAPRVRCELSVGTHFFMEIARLRAARLVWARIVGAAGGDDRAQRLVIGARTSRFTKSALDPHVNLLRATTEAMAAILGQVDSLHVSPFDEPLGLPDEFSRRLARNTQLVLRDESHLDLVVDPAGGSWFVEALTGEVAAAAWRVFQEIEAAGGAPAAFQAGTIQARIAATAAERRRNLAQRRDVLIGTNQYPDAGETPLPLRPVDRAALQATRAKAVQALRSAGDPAARQAALAHLAKVRARGGQRVFTALVDAAAAGATVGDLCRALHHEADPRLQVELISPWRAAAMFERLRAAVAAHADRAAVTVFFANLGDVARYMPRLDFARGFFQVGGFATLADGRYETPAAAAAGFAAGGARTAVIVGLDETYAALAADTARALKAAGAETVVVAGQPGDLVASLDAAGVDQYIHVRADAHAVLSDLARSKGVEL